MNILQLNLQENMQIDDLLSSLEACFSSPCDSTFLAEARVYAHRLPERLLRKLNEFRCLEEGDGLFLLKGFRIDDDQIGPTPAQVGKEIDELSAGREGYMSILLSSFLGDQMGWSSQREGALINNILPVKDHEAEQLSTGSVADLDWHVEEAFHPFRADYLQLMCLRNPDGVPTVIGSIKDLQLDESTRKVLFEPRFKFLTDKNFNNDASMNDIAEPVLFGDFSAPYVRIDPSFMQTIEGDVVAAAALSCIIKEFQRSLKEVVLEQGDVIFIDNYRVVHGRKGFLPRFDGTDRWLKRVNITLDLRKSRAVRASGQSHVITTH
ncbi:guanitoxin biosynthesis L-enduracididine beta-hydroxylase GntD [[Flexibacter] sp. ATCC 35208]|uniref:guanitoxin biosynthesis L-enduracididine beta-hydroxylase GntD n=1 Tax=[Flexibacter] sp. ATCC 35208 TaxID=1936242 RepID=UPI0009CBC8F7|nr:guanitoxin biosynthesis L-enduracididine beta-hydroxylase GntD [[Flexibacter] sp. ATCC 35208]OMP77916.1 hypothetical protein BW716_17730 [[Flexibacter] sp. ATCC 35208]